MPFVWALPFSLLAPHALARQSPCNHTCTDSLTDPPPGWLLPLHLQWQAAVASGKFRAPAAPASSAAAIAMPTFNEVMGFSGTGPEIINGETLPLP